MREEKEAAYSEKPKCKTMSDNYDFLRLNNGQCGVKRTTLIYIISKR